jgi:hypothetical protein
MRERERQRRERERERERRKRQRRERNSLENVFLVHFIFHFDVMYELCSCETVAYIMTLRTLE